MRQLWLVFCCPLSKFQQMNLLMESLSNSAVHVCNTVPLFEVMHRFRAEANVIYFLVALFFIINGISILIYDINTFLIVAVYLAELVLLTFILVRHARRLVRDKCSIPEKRCPGCEDCCYAFWFPCCTIAQMAMQVDDDINDEYIQGSIV
jgi:hypothetical protein